jgi:hypothetical protein
MVPIKLHDEEVQMRSITFGLVCFLLLLGTRSAGQADDAKKARFADNMVFVQIRLKATEPFTDKAGCSCSSPKGRPLADATVTCGYPGAVVEVTWKYVKTTDDGDVYLFTRRFPLDGENTKEEKKQVTYKGKEVVAFEDESQRIGMAPRRGK